MMTRTMSTVVTLTLMSALGSGVHAQTRHHMPTQSWYMPALPAMPMLQPVPAMPVVPPMPMMPMMPVMPEMPSLAPLPSIPMLPLLPYDAQDPADALYRQAREELNSQNYRRAAELFERLIERYPGFVYTKDAYYWRAFALYRINSTDELEEAKGLLEQQRSKYPNASTRGEAEKLLVRVRSELASRGDAREAEAVTRSATRALQQQDCPRGDDDEIKSAALHALLQMDADNAMPILKRIMANKSVCSAKLRRQAVFQISQKRTAETEDMLLDAARNDPDREVREQAVFWLSQVPTDKALSALEGILNSSDDASVQERAIFALSQHRSARAGQILRGWAEGSNHPTRLRAQAIHWLSQQRDPENGKFLRELWPKLPPGQLKESVLFALSQRREAGASQWFMDIALDDKEDIEMRKKALFWAGQMGTVDFNALANLYDRTANREIKEQLIFVYSQRRETAAVDKMMDIAKNEKDKYLRSKAVFWLGQSKDPRVLKFLESLITN